MKKFSEFVNEKAKPPKLTGRDLKARGAKAQVMSALNKDPKFIQMKDKLKQYAERFGKKEASKLGISANLIDYSKIKI